MLKLLKNIYFAFNVLNKFLIIISTYITLIFVYNFKVSRILFFIKKTHFSLQTIIYNCNKQQNCALCNVLINLGGLLCKGQACDV
jgi:hypothetical protein